jgi:cytochrome oxidase Cu insertion factor (SCO1/SenC/PrrC family)
MRRSVWPLTGVAALFIGPFVVAVVLYAGRASLGGFGQLPNPDRELIEKPFQLPLIALVQPDGAILDPAWSRSRWSLIYAKMRACDGRCSEALERLSQVYTALGRDRDRVQQVFLAPTRDVEFDAAAEILIGVLDSPEGAELLRLLGPDRLAEGRIFVVDPLGNVILSYPADADQSRLLKDLERLLDVSRVG